MNFFILCLYVDDLLIIDSCKKEIEDFKGDLSKEFEISDLGDISYFLDIEFYKTSKSRHRFHIYFFVLHFIANVANSKSRHRLFFYPIKGR